MSRDVFVSLDGGEPQLVRVELGGHGYIPGGTVARARRLTPFGPRRLCDPGDWLELEILDVLPKGVGTAPLYRATLRGADSSGKPLPGQMELFA